MSDFGENRDEYIEDPGDLGAVLADLFQGGIVEQTSDVWRDLGGPRPVNDDVAATPDEEAIKNADVVFGFEVPKTRYGKRTRNQSTMSVTDGKKRRKTKLDDFGGDTKAHLRHRKMNNESVKRCREKKKQEHEKLRTGYQKQEEEIQKLKDTIKKLEAAYRPAPPMKSNAIKNLIAENISLKSGLREKDVEIASLTLERDCGFAEVDRLEKALRPFRHQHFEQTWGIMADIEQDRGNELPVNNEVLFNQVINE